eukprot:GHRR01016352.1.p1 GENE.GHRR01016352.1~~GHRR01016352.1.p1  ORF type:complete len:200 (+),score=49.40 GHRR01016352.1:185-784(+)
MNNRPSVLQSFKGAVDKLKEKAAELKAEAKEQINEASEVFRPPQSFQAAPQQILADSRAQSIHLCGFDIQGVSIAGQETCLILPRCKVALDIGRCPQTAVYQQTVLITHGHLDHIGGIPFHASSRMLLGLQPPLYVVLPHYAEKLKQLLQLTNDMEGGMPLQYDVTTLEVRLNAECQLAAKHCAVQLAPADSAVHLMQC